MRIEHVVGEKGIHRAVQIPGRVWPKESPGHYQRPDPERNAICRIVEERIVLPERHVLDIACVSGLENRQVDRSIPG
jgi:hypothetical protein